MEAFLVVRLSMKYVPCCVFFFFFSSRRRHTRCSRDWSSDVCSSDLAKELWWSAGCSAVSPTALAPPTVPASTAPIINSPGRKKAKPCRGGYRPSTLRSTGNGSPTVSASSRSFSRCTEFHKRPTATCCRLKKPKKAVLNQGIFLPHLDNPGVSGHLRGGNAQNHLIFRGFSR